MTSNTPLRLSVLDQSPVPEGSTGSEALQHSVDLARLAEALGYHRYWLAEHHNGPMLAGPSPEALIGAIGAVTSRMRVGSGGVMLPHYSPLKVAETFSVLSGLFPGRVDLGIGRAPGGDQRTALAVGGGRFPDASSFPQQVWELTSLLEEKNPPVRLQPEVDTVPQVWLLGSSDYSGALAAELGLPFAFAHFINPRGGDAVARAYRESFKSRGKPPQVIVCTFAIVAESDDEAERLAASIDLRRLHMALNIDSPVPTLEEAARHRYSDEERRYVLGQRARAVIGGPGKAKNELQAMVERYAADELMVLTITGDYASRRRSYELLIEAF
jgi:luciferase family oxidoreductase group 1